MYRNSPSLSVSLSGNQVVFKETLFPQPMENESDDVESWEQISESFICCVCLDLLYKPIVLACGHVSCFWCVHRTMDGLNESKCPICRHPYGYFPTICQMLHFLLLKMYPVAYKTRETHILEEEKKMHCFSPKVDDLLCASHTKEELKHLDDQAQSFTYISGENMSTILSSTKEETCAKLEQPEFVSFVEDNSPTISKQITTESFVDTCTVVVKGNRLPQRSCNKICASRSHKELNRLDDGGQFEMIQFFDCDGENLSSNFSSNRKEEACAKVEQQELVACIQDNSTTMPKQITAESLKSTVTLGVKENYSPQRSCNKISGQVSIVDVSCAACKQLLFRPAVLNCGHVYCEPCIALAGEAIRCQICQSPHPVGFLKVCLEFDHFLEEQFPEEYTARRGTVQPKEVQFQCESSPTCSTKEGGFFNWLSEHGADVHVRAGCDSCGMYPIKGDRYRCIDCKEEIGFDLCVDCYNTPSKLPGRFNQQHTPDHKFKKEKSHSLRNIILRLLRGDSVNGLLPPSLSGDALENPENENPLVAPLTSSDLEEPENDDTQPPT